jgi:hypothetical protein
VTETCAQRGAVDVVQQNVNVRDDALFALQHRRNEGDLNHNSKRKKKKKGRERGVRNHERRRQ